MHSSPYDKYEGDTVFEDEKLHPVPFSPIAATVARESSPKPGPVGSINKSKPDLHVLSCDPVSHLTDPPLSWNKSPSIDCEMTDPSVKAEPIETAVQPEAGQLKPEASSAAVGKQAPLADDADLEATAALAVQNSQSIERIDSKHNSEDVVPQLSPDKRKDLKVETKSRSPTLAPSLPAADSLTSSPTLQKHMIHPEQSHANLPAVQPNSPPVPGSATSPRKTSGPLPPFQELAQLASIAAQQPQQDHRAQPLGHQHKPSFSSTTSQSPGPRLPIHQSYPGSAQTSPITYPGHSATVRSPASTIGDPPYFGSPYAIPTPQSAYYMDRRPSTATEGYHAMPNVPSLPSGSSSESHGSASNSTAQTTPIDSSAMPDGATPRPILPPPAAMTNMNIGAIFKCDFDGCSAQPFQTQYLLSSHKNVHSSSRPHYCPVPDCPRSEGGKGFKRKNEMIRHGLVHNSPGYICPFCPDRDHRYPRPDNLQRHVRVHHVDKDKDDPALREVLGQRPEGAIQKTRRRRTHSANLAPEAPMAP